jgi:hypothetical protein
VKITRISALMILFFTVSLSAQSGMPEALSYIPGCYHVTYIYSEFDRPRYQVDGFEFIDFKEVKGHFILQHFGIQGDEVLKHWSQDWVNSGGEKWTLKVMSPYDTLRYSCTEKFKQIKDGYEFFCEAKNTPKPIRDTNRSDYDTLDRLHWWHISPEVWG